MNMEFIGKLPIPQEIKAMYPITDELTAIKEARVCKPASDKGRCSNQLS